MFKKIRDFFSFIYLVLTSVSPNEVFEPPNPKKITYIFETTEERLNMVEYLSEECNLTWDEYINFLIYKQYVFHMADKEKLASQIKESEA